ncbi:DUF2316 family protein [Leifsonia sp. Leaf264]|uniref:DUF2316 family protein n=1 Tax=Leifsonia sp. Leaf264 TaxID=1736314 RepID=UPI0006F60A48|nr:DUF2316 family protein [Leifsonia sp. Leaf264]KQO96593.1 hypothetical protein ASF30_15830 [Leifsonia sp. Leaf264]
MSLNREEQRRTSSELAANLELSGLTTEQVATDLGFTLERLGETLDVDGPGDPVDVWQLRDYLVQAVTDAGREPVAFTVLTESSRALARTWFRLRTAPRHAFS